MRGGGGWRIVELPRDANDTALYANVCIVGGW